MPASSWDELESALKGVCGAHQHIDLGGAEVVAPGAGYELAVPDGTEIANGSVVVPDGGLVLRPAGTLALRDLVFAHCRRGAAELEVAPAAILIENPGGHDFSIAQLVTRQAESARESAAAWEALPGSLLEVHSGRLAADGCTFIGERSGPAMIVRGEGTEADVRACRVGSNGSVALLASQRAVVRVVDSHLGANRGEEATVYAVGESEIHLRGCTVISGMPHEYDTGAQSNAVGGWPAGYLREGKVFLEAGNDIVGGMMPQTTMVQPSVQRRSGTFQSLETVRAQELLQQRRRTEVRADLRRYARRAQEGHWNGNAVAFFKAAWLLLSCQWKRIYWELKDPYNARHRNTWPPAPPPHPSPPHRAPS
ncbi:unnamed protein product [Pedinophyceae sp. YPF-701]|nr:unnamed protein product [Pedinophyceae sp. YPF-701]